MTTPFVAACHANDLGEVRRLFALSPDECARQCGEAYHTANDDDVNHFLFRHIVYADEQQHRFFIVRVVADGDAGGLQNYMAQFPVETDLLWEIVFRFKRSDLALCLREHPITCTPMLVAHVAANNDLILFELLCNSEGFVAHAALAMNVFATETEMRLLPELCDALVARGVSVDEMLAGTTPDTSRRINSASFIYLDKRFQRFEASYDEWIRMVWTHLTKDAADITEYLLRKGVSLRGMPWRRVGTYRPTLAQMALDLGLADARQCHTAQEFIRTLATKAQRIRVFGVTPGTFATLPADLRANLRVALVYATRYRLPMGLAFVVLNVVASAYASHVHEQGLVHADEKEHCRKCRLDVTHKCCPQCHAVFCVRCFGL